MAPPLTQNNRERIIELRLRGSRITDICRQTGITKKTVYFWLRRWKESGALKSHHRKIYARATTAAVDAAIVAAHSDDPLLSTRVTSTSYRVSMDTVRRRLKEAKKLVLNQAQEEATESDGAKTLEEEPPVQVGGKSKGKRVAPVSNKADTKTKYTPISLSSSTTDATNTPLRTKKQSRMQSWSQREEETSQSENEIKVFCPQCVTEVTHTAEGIQEDQIKILIAKVYHYLKQEYEDLKTIYGDLDLTPLSNFLRRTALATGVSESTVLQILKEEEGRNADKQQEPPEERCRVRKRSRQTDRVETEIYFPAAVKTELSDIEVEVNKGQAQTDPITFEVKIEPLADVVDDTNETFALTEPVGLNEKEEKDQELTSHPHGNIHKANPRLRRPILNFESRKT